jgi:hypothetical protein
MVIIIIMRRRFLAEITAQTTWVLNKKDGRRPNVSESTGRSQPTTSLSDVAARLLALGQVFSLHLDLSYIKLTDFSSFFFLKHMRGCPHHLEIPSPVSMG